MTTPPVAVPCRVRVPEPLASMVAFSLVPDDVTDRAAPPAAAAAVTFHPVALEDAEASTEKAGLVAP